MADTTAPRLQIRTPLAAAVSVVTGHGLEVPVGVVSPQSSWQPSPVLLVVANLLPTVTGGSSTDVRFRFTGVAGSIQVDDVFIDPRGGH